jgi:hypothetical protein
MSKTLNSNPFLASSRTQSKIEGNYSQAAPQKKKHKKEIVDLLNPKNRIVIFHQTKKKFYLLK